MPGDKRMWLRWIGTAMLAQSASCIAGAWQRLDAVGEWAVHIRHARFAVRRRVATLAVALGMLAFPALAAAQPAASSCEGEDCSTDPSEAVPPVAVPVPLAVAQEGTTVDLHRGADGGARVQVLHNDGGSIHVEFEADNGERGGCYTPCVVVADGGGLLVTSGHASRTVRVEPGIANQEIEVDPGWGDDAYRGYIASFVEYWLGFVGVVLTLALMAADVGADCMDTGFGRVCHPGSWVGYALGVSIPLFLVGSVVQIIAFADPPNGGIRNRSASTHGEWVSASLAPLFDTRGSLSGAAGGLTVRW